VGVECQSVVVGFIVDTLAENGIWFHLTCIDKTMSMDLTESDCVCYGGRNRLASGDGHSRFGTVSQEKLTKGVWDEVL
jgi:hypothetical protein